MGSGTCWAEAVQSKIRDRFLVLFGLIEQDQELAPALQRQSKEKAEGDSRYCLGMVSSNRTSLKCTFYNLELNLI